MAPGRHAGTPAFEVQALLRAFTRRRVRCLTSGKLGKPGRHQVKAIRLVGVLQLHDPDVFRADERRQPAQRYGPLAEIAEAIVVRLSAMLAAVDLLADDREFEHAEHLVINDLSHITARPARTP